MTDKTVHARAGLVVRRWAVDVDVDGREPRRDGAGIGETVDTGHKALRQRSSHSPVDLDVVALALQASDGIAGRCIACGSRLGGTAPPNRGGNDEPGDSCAESELVHDAR